MRDNNITDGVHILQQLAAQNAFVFGAVDVRKTYESGSLDKLGLGSIRGGATATGRRDTQGSVHTTIVEDALRRSMIHIWQAAPRVSILDVGTSTAVLLCVILQYNRNLLFQTKYGPLIY